MNLWAVVEYVTKYATKAPGKSKGLKEVLRQTVDEVCTYAKEGSVLELMRKSLQKVYTKTLGGRDYGIFEAVHLGLGLPLVYSLMRVESLSTDGVRVVKDAEHRKKLQPGDPVVYESRIDKFNRRLELVRRHAKAGDRVEERERREAALRDVSLYEFYSVYDVTSGRISLRTAPVRLALLPFR